MKQNDHSADQRNAQSPNIAWWLVVIAISFGLWFSISARSHQLAARNLPNLPELSGQSNALVNHLRGAHQAAREEPTDSQTIRALATAYHADRFYDHAAKAYELAANLNPTDWKTAYAQAMLHDEMGNAAVAIEHYTRSLAAKENQALGWWRLGMAQLKVGRLDAAQESFDRTLKHNDQIFTGSPPLVTPELRAPLSNYAMLGRGRVAMIKGQIDQARSIFEQLIEESPTFSPAHRMLGRAYEALGRADEAANSHALADQFTPYRGPADPLLDEILVESRHSHVLRKYAEKAEDTQQGRISRIPNLDRALFFSELAVQHNPDDAEAIKRLGGVLFILNQFEDAARHLKQYLDSIAPRTDYNVMNNLFICLIQQGAKDEAEAYLLKLVAEYPSVKVFHNNMGTLYDSKGNVEQAIEAFHKAIALPADPYELPDQEKKVDLAAINALAKLFFSQGRLSDALVHLQKASLLAPDDPKIQFNLGMALLRSSQENDGLKHLRKAVRLSPRSPSSTNALAWHLATSPDSSVYDIAQALQLAQGVAELTRYENPAILDTLAAAYARSERFKEAAEVARQALDLLPADSNEALADRIQIRLEFYEKGKAFVESNERQ